MQQRQLRLGDILDDYCPRERRLTNHAVVAMIGDAVKQTRCTTCDAEHEFKHARVPRPRRKDEPAIAGAGTAPVPRRVVHEPAPVAAAEELHAAPAAAASREAASHEAAEHNRSFEPTHDAGLEVNGPAEREELPEEGPVHRRLIRAQLPKIEGQPATVRQAPDFTIRQPGGGRPGRFRGRPQQQPRGSGGPMFGNRSNGNVARDPRGGQRPQGGRPPMNPRANKPHGAGRKRSK